MMGKVAVILTVLLVLVACGEASPVQQTESAYREQTRVVEGLQDGFSKEEIIDGDHCVEAGVGDRLESAIKDRLGEKASGFRLYQDAFTDGFQLSDVPAQDILRFGIPIPDEYLGYPDELFAPQNTQINVPLYPEYRNDEWTGGRPQHDARMIFNTDEGGFHAFAFVDHWNCDVKILTIGPIQ